MSYDFEKALYNERLATPRRAWVPWTLLAGLIVTLVSAVADIAIGGLQGVMFVGFLLMIAAMAQSPFARELWISPFKWTDDYDEFERRIRRRGVTLAHLTIGAATMLAWVALKVMQWTWQHRRSSMLAMVLLPSGCCWRPWPACR